MSIVVVGIHTERAEWGFTDIAPARIKADATVSALKAASCMCKAQASGVALTKALKAGDYSAAFTASEALSAWLRRGFYYQGRARNEN